ncbi:host specificity factor TipJ family phage tail protein [Marinobacter sp. NSM]|uniref:host specificity factor TipJ family phage tail protein n=1 Tax=Marinobacter sp. NSM TaxID=3458004 RepID=UPI0040374863
MTIKVFDTIMPAEPAEVYRDHGMTVEEWLKGQTDDYKPGPVQPVSCAINGAIVDPLDWADVVIGERDNVEFRVVPFGSVGDFFSSTLGVVLFPGASLSYQAGQAAIDALINIPSQSSGGRGQQGAQISPADAKANTARLGQGIPELFGRYIRYPDYVNQPRKYYRDARTQAQHIMLCVTTGRCLIETALLKLGETPFSQLGDSISYQIFEPGEDVSGHPAHENWYNAPEVGATTGSSGIRLYRGRSLSSGLDNVQLNYNSNEIRTTSASVFFPGDWAEGDFIAISARQSVTVSVDVDDIVTLTGDWGDADVGDQVRLRSTESAEANGVFLIASKAGNDITITQDGSPVTGWTAGSFLMFARREDEDFRIDGIIHDTTYPDLIDGYSLSRFIGGAEDAGWSSFPGGTGYADVFLASRSEADGWAGPFTACPAGETTSSIEIDVFLPQGQGKINDDKVVPFESKRQIEIQWRELGGTTWTSQIYTLDNATRDQLGFTYQLNLGSAIRPEVRVRRVTAESSELAHLDRIEWQALKARLPTVTSYAGVTTMAVTIEGTDQIGSASNNRINLVATRLLPGIDGGALTAEAPTRSIAAAAVHVAKSLGYTDDQIDLDEFEQIAGLWQSRGDYFDFVINDGTAKEAIEKILRAGFASMTLSSGVITPVRDGPRTQFEQPYSPENMTAPLQRSFATRKPEEPDGVEVEYTNAETWTTETVKCLLPGDQGIKLDKIKLDGVTDRTKAWRIGMRRRRSQRYRRWTYSFTTELDALNSDYLSYVPLIDDIPGYGKASVLRAVDTTGTTPKLIVSQPMDWQDGESHVVAYRNAYGDLVGPWPATRGETDYEIIAAVDPLPEISARHEPPHVFFGTNERWSFPALITEISPQGELEVSVSATNYDERVYADDDNSPP